MNNTLVKRELNIGNKYISILNIELIRKPMRYGRSSSNLHREKPIIFLDLSESNCIKDIFTGERYNKPYNMVRPFLKKALKEAGIPEEELSGIKFNWNKHAGCKMCPCSPGFIVSGANNLNGYNVYITYKYN